MATIREVREKLEAMSPKEFEEFKRRFGGDGSTPAWYIDVFVHKPEHERRLCQLLGLQTEQEKQVEAAIDSANAAKRSAKLALVAVVVSVVSALAAWFAVLK